MSQGTLPFEEGKNRPRLSGGDLLLKITLEINAGHFLFQWLHKDDPVPIAAGRLFPAEEDDFLIFDEALEWTGKMGGEVYSHSCKALSASTRALANRLRKFLPVSDDHIQVGVLATDDLGPVKASEWFQLTLKEAPWKWIEREVFEFAKGVAFFFKQGRNSKLFRSHLIYLRACAALNVKPDWPGQTAQLLDLRILSDQTKSWMDFYWNEPETGKERASGRVQYTGPNQVTWELTTETGREVTVSSCLRDSIRESLQRWIKRFPTNRETFAWLWVNHKPGTEEPVLEQEPPFTPDESIYQWIEDHLTNMLKSLHEEYLESERLLQMHGSSSMPDFERYERRLQRKAEKNAQLAAQRQKRMAQIAGERARKKALEPQSRKTLALKKSKKDSTSREAALSKPVERSPMPPVSVHFDFAPLSIGKSGPQLADLAHFSLRERAALWWISNQSDDLLCLPNCRIQHLEYQLRTALRILGPLRGRALLSDEVGLGKTIEAGLVIKELLTRGMIKRFLVLTVPSLVDQWEEELSDKFGLITTTTNKAESRSDLEKFWRDHVGIVASLHTLKQPAQLAVAREIHWDILIVDEAHYLRNRESQAWQAVNALSRQFLLLLTATPVQNSLEELYNLVTLLQPGQLPSPKEFKSRFLDPKRPRQPREPEELRRLLGQVMIRNTRANAGLQLPPRRAETVLFEPDDDERAFWQQWESEFRTSLSKLNASQSSLWGRLVLQALGSSPAAWRSVLEKFPDRTAARAWRDKAALESSWKKKCELIPPLTRVEGGAVIFTQFLETQAALEKYLKESGVETFIINGSTPAPERQPITEAFRRQSGALILTHSGTEGRNLQFSHRLANFDLPWNPMEIEQRIGRLHRLGQKHPVRIFNFVQAGTLQEHLLQILQEKLNLFELVVGETGLILGERFSSDEFAEEVFRRWRENEGRVGEALTGLGEELATANNIYNEVKKLDDTLFSKDYESV